MDRRIGSLDISLMMALDALFVDENVTHAAARLNISQSALSGRLNKLRRIFNDPLFITASTGRGVTPTPHALALKSELEYILEKLEGFVKHAYVFDPASSGKTFRIAASDNPAAIIAPNLISLIHKRAPNVKVAFVSPDKLRVNELLEAGDIDLYIGSVENISQNFIGRNLFDDKLVTAQRIGHPRGTGSLSLEEFCACDHVLISSDGGAFSGVIDEALSRIGKSRKVSTSIQSYSLAPLIVSSTDCLCTLPRRFLERFSHKLDLFPPPVQLDQFFLKCFWHPKVSADPANQWLRSMIVEATTGYP